ncbi:response regulator [Shimia abyssi]|uniref:DNA-binding response OmpR family regulator n=1 Tax=Shimia abyssi TaxID=1662395 RepID=A0A2P8FDB0_9RHOB|nr:response regulator [Shimia abyssi]PSL19693.1 DNA-binding response OmpR family regulator [Shimia abyssi]
MAVDDDESIRELLIEAVAAKSAHTIKVASSGPEAIRMLARENDPFDCFLLDIQMPIMDGITLCSKIRKTKGYARKPILMLTAMSQKKYIDAAFTAGATDFITKPFDFLELFTRINVADKLAGEQARVIEGTSEMSALKRDLMTHTAHSLNEPVELSGITQVVGYVAFENYLMQLSRASLLRSSVFAIKIAGVERLFDSVSHISFRQMLSDIASETMSVLAENDAMATYRGNGMFLVMVPKIGAFSHTRFEVELNSRLDYVPSLHVDDQNVKICVGEPVSMRSLTRAGAMFSLQKAGANAEQRAKNQKEILSLLRRTARVHRRSGFQSEMERRAYEVLLQDALREENTLPDAKAYG